MSFLSDTLGTFCDAVDCNKDGQGYSATALGLSVWCSEKKDWLSLMAQGPCEESALAALQDGFKQLPQGTFIKSSTSLFTRQLAKKASGWEEIPSTSMPLQRRSP